MAYDPTFTIHLIGYMGGLLLLIGIVSIVWLRLSFGSIAYLIKLANRLGLYNPSPPSNRSAPGGAIPRDRSFILFSRTLRGISKVIPGEARGKPRTVILPLLLVGLPLGVFFLIMMWAIPLLLFGWIIGTVPGWYSVLIAFLSVFTYMAVLVGSWRFAKSQSTRIYTVREFLDWR